MAFKRDNSKDFMKIIVLLFVFSKVDTALFGSFRQNRADTGLDLMIQNRAVTGLDIMITIWFKHKVSNAGIMFV